MRFFNNKKKLKDLEVFKNKFPNSDVLNEVDFEIIFELHHSRDDRNKIKLGKTVENFIISYPSDAKINEVERWKRKKMMLTQNNKTKRLT